MRELNDEELFASIHFVIKRWYKIALLRFNSHDDGSDDLLITREIINSIKHAQGETPEEYMSREGWQYMGSASDDA